MADRRLLIWTLASFHVAGLTIGFVLPAYVSGGLSDVLPEFGTVPGFLGYGYLWVLSYLATRWVLTEAVFEETMAGSIRTVLLRGTAGGGLVGLATLLGPLLLVSIPDLVTGGGDLTSAALVFAIGSGLAAVVGAAFGIVFTLIDLAALRVADAVVPEAPGPARADVEPATVDADQAGEGS